MKNNKFAGLLSLILILSLILGGCGSTSAPANVEQNSNSSNAGQTSSEDKAITFRINSPISGVGTLQDKAVDEIIQKLNEKSNGRIKGTKIAGGVLGAERELTEAIQLNTVDMSLISDMGIDSVVGKLGWAWMPFLFTSYEDADKYYNNGWIGEELGKQMGKAGIIRLAATENDFRLVSNVKHPIINKGDFKGLKIRTPEIPEVLKFYELAGALPVGIASSEVLTALEQGTIDGVDNTVYNYKVLGVLDSLKYITNINYMYSSGSIICSKQFWNSLSPEDQELFREVAKEAGDNFRIGWREETKRLIDEGVAAGTFEVADMNDEMRSYLKEVALQLWDIFGEKYDPELVKRIKTEFGTN